MKLISLLLSAALASQDTGATKAPKSEHQQHVDKSGDRVMGFSHEKTTHHFLLDTQGGVIEVSANDAKDTSSRDQIQKHLGHIAGMFTKGNFEAPMLVHGVKPPGTQAMTRLGSEIKYAYESIPSGGRVTITTKNRDALAAIHEFLRFQIKDHATGDSGKVAERKR
jgi:hypothetical protein